MNFEKSTVGGVITGGAGGKFGLWVFLVTNLLSTNPPNSTKLPNVILVSVYQNNM